MADKDYLALTSYKQNKLKIFHFGLLERSRYSDTTMNKWSVGVEELYIMGVVNRVIETQYTGSDFVTYIRTSAMQYCASQGYYIETEPNLYQAFVRGSNCNRVVIFTKVSPLGVILHDSYSAELGRINEI